MPADYILRLIEQVSLMLAELSRLRAGEKPARISALCLRETGLPLDFVKHSSPETILQLLESGGHSVRACSFIGGNAFTRCRSKRCRRQKSRSHHQSLSSRGAAHAQHRSAFTGRANRISAKTRGPDSRSQT